MTHHKIPGRYHTFLETYIVETSVQNLVLMNHIQYYNSYLFPLITPFCSCESNDDCWNLNPQSKNTSVLEDIEKNKLDKHSNLSQICMV